MELRIKLDTGAFMPERAHGKDMGLDIKSPVDITVPPCRMDWLNDTVEIGSAFIDSGVHIQLPPFTGGLLKSKSGLNVKHGITGEGVIDEGYTGSIGVKLYNHTGKAYRVRRGDKIIQLCIVPYAPVDLVEVEELEETDRGDGGFGSTGR